MSAGRRDSDSLIDVNVLPAGVNRLQVLQVVPEMRNSCMPILQRHTQHLMPCAVALVPGTVLCSRYISPICRVKMMAFIFER